MQLRQHIGCFAYSGDHIVGEVFRMRRCEADPFQAVNLTAGTKQVREGASVTKLDPVGVDVLTEKGHLLNSLGDQCSDLGEDVTWPAVGLSTPQGGHDAEGGGAFRTAAA